jgi:hypothetical protein
LPEYRKGGEQPGNIYYPEEEKAHQENKGYHHQTADIYGNEVEKSAAQNGHESPYQKGEDERNGNARREHSENMSRHKTEAVNNTVGLPLGKVHPKNDGR